MKAENKMKDSNTDLVASAASETSQSTLNSARSRVNVRFES